MLDLYEKISEFIVVGNIEEVKELTQQALEENAQPQEIIDKGLLPGMNIVGQHFKVNEMFLPEVIRSGKAMHSGMAILEPLLSSTDKKGIGTVVIGTVEGDLHDIGKNMVAMLLQGAGFNVIDLGVDVNPGAFVKAVKENSADILGMSALLTTTIQKMRETINAFSEAGIRNQINVMIGGAPVSVDFADEIGADAFGPNAIIAVEKARELMGLC